MKSEGKGGSSHKNKHHHSGRKDDIGRYDKKKHGDSYSDGKNEKNIHERPRWTAPKPPSTPIPVPSCPWCNKPIKDITSAISDKNTGLPVHFECVLARINEMEKLQPNERVCYIGGGRFGVVHNSNPNAPKNFTIRRIYEWENKDEKEEWRSSLKEHFSIT
jgi:hypothetical protein